MMLNIISVTPDKLKPATSSTSELGPVPVPVASLLVAHGAFAMTSNWTAMLFAELLHCSIASLG